MRKKKHAVRTFLTTLVPALALCLGLGTAAMAADTKTEAKITKNLQMDKNVTTPTATFTFNVTKVSVDDSTDTNELNSMPAITGLSLSFSDGDKGTTDAVTGLKQVTKTTSNIIPAATSFPHAGKYVYKVEEAKSGYTGTASTKMTYSKAEFTLDIYVKNGDSGLEIAGVSVAYVKDDAGDAKTEKVGDTWQFVNKFEKTSDLVISNTIGGAMGDKTKQFTYTLEFTKAALEENNASYEGTITRADNKTEKVTISNTNKTFTLADGESVTFSALPVGTTCSVTETEDKDYATTVTVTSNGTTGAAKNALASGPVTVGEDNNEIAYTNTKGGNVPTGIVVDNLPFIILILVALCGFAGYVALKRRKYHN